MGCCIRKVRQEGESNATQSHVSSKEQRAAVRASSTTINTTPTQTALNNATPRPPRTKLVVARAPSPEPGYAFPDRHTTTCVAAGRPITDRSPHETSLSSSQQKQLLFTTTTRSSGAAYQRKSPLVQPLRPESGERRDEVSTASACSVTFSDTALVLTDSLGTVGGGDPLMGGGVSSTFLHDVVDIPPCPEEEGEDSKPLFVVLPSSCLSNNDTIAEVSLLGGAGGGAGGFIVVPVTPNGLPHCIQRARPRQGSSQFPHVSIRFGDSDV